MDPGSRPTHAGLAHLVKMLEYVGLIEVYTE